MLVHMFTIDTTLAPHFRTNNQTIEKKMSKGILLTSIHMDDGKLEVIVDIQGDRKRFVPWHSWVDLASFSPTVAGEILP